MASIAIAIINGVIIALWYQEFHIDIYRGLEEDKHVDSYSKSQNF